MKKFTIFTILFTVVVIVSVVEIFANNYLPDPEAAGSDEFVNILPTELDFSKTLQTDITSPDSKIEVPEKTEVSIPRELSPESEWGDISIQDDTNDDVTEADDSDDADFEDINFLGSTNFQSIQQDVYIRDEQLRSAGFIDGYVEEDEYDGQMFKSIFTGDLMDVDVKKYELKTDSVLFSKAYVFKIGIGTDPAVVYETLKSRAAEEIDVNVNETNQFGGASFYMNDSRRKGTVFLTTRIGSFIYGFSYPKEYHSQIKNLIQLIEWELG